MREYRLQKEIFIKLSYKKNMLPFMSFNYSRMELRLEKSVKDSVNLSLCTMYFLFLI